MNSLHPLPKETETEWLLNQIIIRQQQLNLLVGSGNLKFSKKVIPSTETYYKSVAVIKT